jgi:DNA-binding XRE family transcriptional regulator/predicted RNase H-like HicB family nuclease
MFYIAHVSREGKHLLAEFPDAPGCQTFAGSEAKLREAAKEALEGWLEAHLVGGQAPHRPRRRVVRSRREMAIRVRPGLSAAVQLRWARQDANLSQKQLAERAGVSQQQIAKLEDPDENPTLATLEKVFDALGLQVDLEAAPKRKAVA